MPCGDSEVTFKSGAEILAVTEHDQESGSPEHLDGQAFTVDGGDNPRESTPDVIQVHQDHSFGMLSPGMAMHNKSLMQDSSKMVLKPEKFEGKVDWAEYISHFQDCAELGNWDDRSKCLLLAANLRGATRKYYDGLRVEEKDYQSLQDALKRRFGNEHRQEFWMSKLEMRRRKTDESISDLGDDIWQKTQRAYHDFDLRLQEQLALKHFYCVIDSEMKLKCVENKCTNIYDAVAVVERYEALYEDHREGRKVHVCAVEKTPCDSLKTEVEQLRMQLKSLETRQNQSEQHRNSRAQAARQQRGRSVVCYQCGEAGHYRVPTA